MTMHLCDAPAPVWPHTTVAIAFNRGAIAASTSPSGSSTWRPLIPAAPLGQMLQRLSWITSEQLETALVKQHETHQKLGDCLVHSGYLTDERLDLALSNQSMKLGEIILHREWLTPAQLTALLNAQHDRYVPLGELAVQRGLITPAQLTEALNEQYWRRNGFWMIA